MRKATDELRKTHRVIQKVLESLEPGTARFADTATALHRTLRAHAALQDNVLAPALRKRSLIGVPYLDDTEQDHLSFHRLTAALLESAARSRPDIDTDVQNLRTRVEEHLRKESRVLYPYAEGILDGDTLYQLGNDMVHYRHPAGEHVKI